MRRSSVLPATALALILALAPALGGCTLVSPYDQDFDTEITATQRDTDTLLLAVAGDPAKPYADFRDAYQTVNVDLAILLVRAESHPHNADTVDSVRRIIASFQRFETRHRNATPANPLSDALARDTLGIINHEFGILLGQEFAKRSSL